MDRETNRERKEGDGKQGKRTDGGEKRKIEEWGMEGVRERDPEE